MSTFLRSWLAAAAEVLAAELSPSVDPESGVETLGTAPTLALTVELAGCWEGSFTVTTEQTALSALVSGRSPGADVQGHPVEAAQAEWKRLFGRICVAAAAGLESCEVAMISFAEAAPQAGSMGYRICVGEAVAVLRIADQATALSGAKPVSVPAESRRAATGEPAGAAAEQGMERGMELLLDVELEASLRFGSREMALSDLLALGPGDVVQLDRALSDPVDLVIGDKIVARGEVVLVNGNFGLQVTEVAEPRKSLESIRCLF